MGLARLTAAMACTRSAAFLRWLAEHGLEAKDTFEVTVDSKAGTVKARQYARDEGGRVKTKLNQDNELEPVTGEVTVELRSPLPKEGA